MGSPEKPIDVEMGDMNETDKLNPDVKVEDGTEKVEPEEERFTGLKKEELLEISSKKQWVVARWVLFILFWVGWVGMLVGAIIIVVQAPRCKKEPTPSWYQDTVVYQADVRKFAGDFEGMSSHLKYIKSLNAPTVAICHASNPENHKDVVNNEKSQFEELLEKAHKEEMKIIVDIPIDTVSTNSEEFQKSATPECAGKAESPCDMFTWVKDATGVSAGDGAQWIHHDQRNESYKASATDNSLAFLNYVSTGATLYLQGVLDKWIGYGVDGFQLKDLANVENARDVVEGALNFINASQQALDEEKKREIGMFLMSSSKDTASQAALFGSVPASNDTKGFPVVINTQMAAPLQDSGTGKQLMDIISNWREETEPFIGAYAVNTMDLSPLVNRYEENRTAALTLLSLALPGVPVIRSPDETLLPTAELVWDPKKEDNSPPANLTEAGKATIKMVTEMAGLRVLQFKAMQSLRWDNEDSTFEFRETGSEDVLAFTRVWDKKPKVLIITNLSVNEAVIKFKLEENEKSKAKVLVTSGPSIEEYDLKSTEPLRAGLTMVLQLDKES